jgi:CubicO group peptidase (beta-lactamase class C family)
LRSCIIYQPTDLANELKLKYRQPIGICNFTDLRCFRSYNSCVEKIAELREFQAKRRDMFKKLIDNKKLGGVNCIIWKDGQIIYEESQGYKNLETRELMTIDTIFRIASMTKPITSVVTMMLLEEGKLDLYDPITKWFPQFTNMKVLKNQLGEYEDATRHITILDLLTHRSGLTYSDFQKENLKMITVVL